MYIDNLKLQNFRNYDVEEFNFIPNINFIYGDNAQGKSNIVEAIYLYSIGKSYRTKNDKELVKFDKLFSSVELSFFKSERKEKIKINISDEKNIEVNDIKIKKLSELIRTFKYNNFQTRRY